MRAASAPRPGGDFLPWECLVPLRSYNEKDYWEWSRSPEESTGQGWSSAFRESKATAKNTPPFHLLKPSSLLSALMLSPPRPLFPGTGRPPCLVPALGEGVCSGLARSVERLCPRFPLGGQAALTDLWSPILSQLLPQEGWKGRKEGKTRHQGPALGAQEALCRTGKSGADKRKKSMFTWDYWNKGWPAGWPTTSWQGRLLPLPGSEVLSVLSLLLSEFLFCVGPECPSRGRSTLKRIPRGFF